MGYADKKLDDLLVTPISGLDRNLPEMAAASTGYKIVSSVLAGYEGPVAVRLWDGQIAAGRRNVPCTLVFHHPGALRELILHRDLLRLAEAYIDGGVDIEGDLEALFDLAPYLARLQLPWSMRLNLVRKALQLPAGLERALARSGRAGWAAHRNSRASIAHHYDVSNDFYRLWLDPEMVYSCAYFRDADQPLAEAQRDKLDYICRKLRLSRGQTLLDIGCGWGALACWAARRYEVQVHGITLSREQQLLARERVRDAGLDGRVKIELRDYRDLPGDTKYDRVVSVGMFEHIGVRNFPTYFGTVKRVLKPGGLFLNHGITNDTGWQRTPLTRFINRYIFPDGELARISDVSDAMEQAGFEVLDVESLRRHYALTLRRWVRALESNRDEVVRASSVTTYRLWRLYMAGSAYYFDEGSMNVYQVLAGQAYRPLAAPLRRDDLYVHGPARVPYL